MPTARPQLSRLLTLVATFLVACAPAPAASTATSPHDRNVITASELSDVMIANGSVLEAITKLRPRFLNAGVASSTKFGSVAPTTPTNDAVMASINGASPVPLSELGRMSASEVSEIQYLSVADAGFRFGLAGSTAPVILVTLKQR